MSLITWEPAAELAQFRRQFDALFDSYLAPAAGIGSASWNPVCKLAQGDSEFTLTVEVPGVDEKDVSVQLAGNVLTIKASRSTSAKEKGRSSSWSGSFERSMTLPDTVNQEKIEATYSKGLLSVRLPKLPQAKARSIPITAS